MLTTSIDENFAPNVRSFAATDVVPDALINTVTTVAADVDGDAAVVNALYVDDSSATFVAEGADISQSDPPLASVAIATGKVASLLKVSRELWEQPQVGGQLAISVARTVTKAANNALLNQAAPVAPAVTPPAGLLTYDLLDAAAPIAGSLDGMIDLIAQLEANGATPTSIVIDPLGWAALRRLKEGTASNKSLLGSGTTDSAHKLLDIDVLVSPAMPASTGLVVDQAAIVSAAGPVQMSQSEHVYFNADAIAVRCTWRFGAVPVRPDRIGRFTVATA